MKEALTASTQSSDVGLTYHSCSTYTGHMSLRGGGFRARLQRSNIRKILAKYSGRERSRAGDFLHKVTASLSRELKGYMHGFESLEKKWMFGGSREHNRNTAKSDWKKIIA